jgi:adenylate kinase family enzyme
MPPEIKLSLRVLVVGTSCSGKSTFARELAAIAGRRCVELDEIYWGPNWTHKTDDEFRAATAQAITGEEWIVEGNYRAVREVLWPRATLVVWLNYSFSTVFGRALRRTLRRGFSRQELWHGNRESLWRSLFTTESILWWVITTFHHRRRQFTDLRAAQTYPNLSWTEFRRPDEASTYLSRLRDAGD